MPNNILKDFFYGNINPNEKQFDRNSEYGKAAAGLADEEEKLRSMLDQEAATVLDKMICLQAAIAGMTAEEYFIDGLRTGFRLALAILDEEENGVKLEGKYFEPQVQNGDTVKKGQLLMKFDLDAIKAAGYDVTTPVVVTNGDRFAVKPLAEGTIVPGAALMKLEAVE